MLKILSLAVGLNLLGILSFFQDESIHVSQLVPLTLAPGEAYEVKVNFKKPDISGFAKFEVEVDNDLEVMIGDIGSASFTFENGVAKFIWFALPEEQNFTISYFLRNNAEKIGSEKSIYAHFSYLEDNTKKVYELPDHKILIEVYSNDSIVATTDVVSTESSTKQKSISERQNIKNIRAHTVTMQREFERLDNGFYRMNITIDKGPINGFAKLEEVVPEGFEYEEENTTGAIFTKIKGKAKFVWFNLPEVEKINISYNLSAIEANVIGLHNITGEFTYIVDDLDIVSKTVPAFFKISTKEMVDALEKNELDTDEEIVDQIEKELLNNSDGSSMEGANENTFQVTDENLEFDETSDKNNYSEMNFPVDTNSENDREEETLKTWPSDTIIKSKAESTTEMMNKTKEESPEIASNEQDSELVEEITGISSSNEGVLYRVQICATKKVAEKDYFKKYKRVNFEVSLENHEGWIKYTTGGYPLYARARKSREMIDQDFELDGPFVTAYSHGERITVQEALMISGQKWFQ